MRTTGHVGRVGSILKRRTKPRLSANPPKPTEKNRLEKRNREAQRRREGFEWLFE
jgi:hypothetical protein